MAIVSDPAKVFIQKSVWQRRWNRLRIASGLILLLPIVDYALHIQKIEQYYNKFNGANQAAERESAMFLTQHL